MAGQWFVSRFIFAMAAMSLIAAAAWAQPSGGPGGGERPQGPPREAVEACRSLASGVACSFTDREGQKLTGTCSGPPSGGAGPKPQGAASAPTSGKGTQGGPPLACRPDRAGAPGGREPPKDAPKR